MKLIEHLEFVINLVGKATDSEIKGHLVAMREEISGYEATADKQAAFDEEQSRKDKKIRELETELEKMKSQPSPPPQIRMNFPGGTIRNPM